MTKGDLLFIVVWIASFFYSLGTLYAEFQRRYPAQADQSRREDAGAALGIACAIGILGPLGVFIVMCLSGFNQHGWLFPGRRP